MIEPAANSSHLISEDTLGTSTEQGSSIRKLHQTVLISAPRGDWTCELGWDSAAEAASAFMQNRSGLASEGDLGSCNGARARQRRWKHASLWFLFLFTCTFWGFLLFRIVVILVCLVVVFVVLFPPGRIPTPLLTYNFSSREDSRGFTSCIR